MPTLVGTPIFAPLLCETQIKALSDLPTTICTVIAIESIVMDHARTSCILLTPVSDKISSNNNCLFSCLGHDSSNTDRTSRSTGIVVHNMMAENTNVQIGSAILYSG